MRVVTLVALKIQAAGNLRVVLSKLARHFPHVGQLAFIVRVKLMHR
jgi:hypothetical protein